MSAGRHSVQSQARRVHLALACVLMLCATPAIGSSQQSGRTTRTFAGGAWKELWQIGQDSELLLRPELLAVTRGRAVVFDYGDFSLKSIRLGKGLEWRVGRRGGGPGEFRNPTDLRVDARGRAFVLDPSNARITIIDAAGKVVGTVPLTGNYVRMAPPLSDTTFLLLSTRRDTLATIVDRKGRPLHTAPVPAWLTAVPPLAREPVGVGHAGAGYVISYRWSGALSMVGPDGKGVRVCSGVDNVPFPPTRTYKVKLGEQPATVTRIDAKAREVVAAMTVADKGMALLTAGTGKDRRRVLDYYKGPCGPYVGSRRLPYPPALLETASDSVVAIVSEPVPYLVVLRWRGATER